MTRCGKFGKVSEGSKNMYLRDGLNRSGMLSGTRIPNLSDTDFLHLVFKFRKNRNTHRCQILGRLRNVTKNETFFQGRQIFVMDLMNSKML